MTLWFIIWGLGTIFSGRRFARYVLEDMSMDSKGFAGFLGWYVAVFFWPAVWAYFGFKIAAKASYSRFPGRIERIFIAAPPKQKAKRDELAELRARNAELERELDLV